MQAKKVTKKEAIFNYLRENPNAKNKDVAKACGVHYTYVSLVRRNAGVKKPKAVKTVKVVKKKEDISHFNDETLMLNSIANLRKENFNLKDTVIRLHGIIDYLEQKLEHATSV